MGGYKLVRCSDWPSLPNLLCIQRLVFRPCDGLHLRLHFCFKSVSLMHTLLLKSVLRSLPGFALLLTLAGCSVPMGPMTDSAGAPPPRGRSDCHRCRHQRPHARNRLWPQIHWSMPCPALTSRQSRPLVKMTPSGPTRPFGDGMQMVQIFKGTGGKIGCCPWRWRCGCRSQWCERLGMTFAQAHLPRRACRVGQESLARHGHLQGGQHRKSFARLCHFRI